jgi:hypothetical protein
MPDQTVTESGEPEIYRCTLLHADDVLPPAVAGEVALRTVYADRTSADLGVEEGVARTDIGRIILDAKLPGGAWQILHSWTRTPNGWHYQTP